MAKQKYIERVPEKEPVVMCPLYNNNYIPTMSCQSCDYYYGCGKEESVLCTYGVD